MALCYGKDTTHDTFTQETIALSVNRHFTDEDDIVVCPDCGTPYHRACWQKVGACMHKSEHAAGFEWQPEFGPDAEKRPRTRPPARTAAPTTSRARRSAATAAVPCRRTTAPDPTRRTRTRRCRSTPATRPPCINPTTAARPPAPASTPTPQTTTAASAAARSAPRILSTASRPRTGPPTWAAARCIT